MTGKIIAIALLVGLAWIASDALCYLGMLDTGFQCGWALGFLE
jgi:hypothetical protein